MRLRDADHADLPEIQAIYAFHVLTGVGSFEETPPSIEDMQQRFDKIIQQKMVWLVAENTTGVIGYASCAPYHHRSAFRFTVESSIYVRNDMLRCGVGHALLGALLPRAAARGYHQMVAVVGDSANHGSIALHMRHGFRHAGTLQDVGLKHGRWLDAVLLQRALTPP
jgi:L-amino acid N-acyltransferase YncA